MKIYIDLCVLCRPFDDQTQPRIMIETIGVIAILSIASAGGIEIINSFVLEYENSLNQKAENKIIIDDILRTASRFIPFSSTIMKRAQELECFGITGMDALHLSCAEHAHADYFVTCDDMLIKKAQKITDIRVSVLPLLEFISRKVFYETGN
jgi:predicted nucleic acid-binding protein